MPGATPSEGTPQNDQAFVDAFAAATAADGIPPASEPVPAAEPAAAPAAAEAPAEGAAPADEGAAPAAAPEAAPAGSDAGTPGAGGEEPAAAGTKAEPPAAAPPAAPAQAPATADDIVKGLADLLKGQPAAEAAPAPAAEPEQAPLYSQDEVNVLADYEKNWPDVAQAETLKRRAEYHDMMKFVFGEVAKYTQPLFDQMRLMGNTIHLGELRQSVPDYSDALEADVAQWIDTQPTYLQAPMKQVMQQGTSDEVADLIGRYRAATGTAQAPAAAAASVPAAPAKPAKTELSSAAKQAAESLAPVSGDRSQVPQGEDPQDFQTAFARYAADAMPK